MSSKSRDLLVVIVIFVVMVLSTLFAWGAPWNAPWNLPWDATTTTYNIILYAILGAISVLVLWLATRKR